MRFEHATEEQQAILDSQEVLSQRLVQAIAQNKKVNYADSTFASSMLSKTADEVNGLLRESLVFINATAISGVTLFESQLELIQMRRKISTLRNELIDVTKELRAIASKITSSMFKPGHFIPDTRRPLVSKSNLLCAKA